VKAALILLTLCLVLALGAFGLFTFNGARDPGGPHAAVAASSLASPAVSTDARPGDVEARMDAMAREIDELRAQVATLKAGAEREPAAEAASEKPADSPSTASFASEHRDAILKVIDEDREEQKRKADEEQRARDLQNALARAERTAKQFGLAADQQKSLADVYILERQKMEDLRGQMRDQGGMGGDPEAMRQSFRELRDWRLNQLTTRFGDDLGGKINDADLQRFGGGFGGGRRGNGGNGPGGNGSGNGPGGGL
jgi:hypothetical protein